MNDPMERIIADALDAASLTWTHDAENEHRLDFDVPELEIAIEVKQFHSDRISEQMSRTPNVIAVQGKGAVHALAKLIRAYGRTEDKNEPSPEKEET